MREYDILAAAGVTPESSMAAVKDAAFTLMAQGMTPEQRAAWDRLRNPETRLALDFLVVALQSPTPEDP